MPPAFPLTLCAILGCGLMAGLFFAFSVCVMKALGNLAPVRGIAAMQSINIAILNPAFLLVFMETAAACVFALIFSLLNKDAPGARFLLIGSLLYLVGVLLVTMIFNVPMNDALASVKADSSEGSRVWADYLGRWTAWNHVRTAASLGATAFFALALHRQGQ